MRVGESNKLSSMSLTFSGSIIGISYGEMNSVKSNLRRASDMLQQSQSKVNSAKVKVQVDRSSSRLRLSEEQISTIYTNAAKQKTKIDKLCNNIDITIRKFKEVDARCAARIRSISKSYDKSKSLWERIKSAVSSFSTFAMNGFKSLIDMGNEALSALGQKASEGFNDVSEWMDKHPVVADTLEIVGGIAQAAAYAALFANPITAPIAAVGLIFSAGSILESGSKLFNYLTTGNNKGINVLEMAFETVGEKLGGDKGKAIGDTIYNVMNTGVMVGGLVIDCGLTLTKTGEIIKDSEGAIKGLKALSEGAKAAESIKLEALKNFLVNPLKDLVDAGKYLRDNFIPPINFGKLSLAGVDNINIGKIAEDFARGTNIGNMSSDSGISGLINKINKIVDDFAGEGVAEKERKTYKILKTTEELLEETTCSKDDLVKYLKSCDDYFKTNFADEFLKEGKWPDDIQIPKSPDVLTSKGKIDWDQVPDSGYVLDSDGNAIKEAYFPKKGELIDRFGPSDGTFTSPVSNGSPYSYDNRSLPYLEDLNKYHQYEVVDDLSKLGDYIKNCNDQDLVDEINGFMKYKRMKSYDELISYKGEIAPGFGASGGGIQYQLPLTVDILEELGLLKLIK